MQVAGRLGLTILRKAIILYYNITTAFSSVPSMQQAGDTMQI